MKRLVLLGITLALAGCNAALVYRSGNPAPPASQAGGLSVQAHVPGNNLLGAMLITVLLADGVRQFLRRPDGSTVSFPGAEGDGDERRVNLHDCTRPPDPGAGNLMCR